MVNLFWKTKRWKLKTKTQEGNNEIRKEVLTLQRDFIKQEIADKKQINKLTIENLKLDAEIKRLTLQKLRANFIYDFQ